MLAQLRSKSMAASIALASRASFLPLSFGVGLVLLPQQASLAKPLP